MGKGWHKPVQIFSFLYPGASICYAQGVCTGKRMWRKKSPLGLGLSSVSTAKGLDVVDPAGRNSVRVELKRGSVLVLESKFPHIVTIILG